jgi:hypothetical protein
VTGYQVARGRDDPCVFDLSQRTFFHPADLVDLAVRTEDAVLTGCATFFVGPDDVDVAHYLARMRVGEHLDRLAIPHRLPAVRARDLGSRLVELHRFDQAAGLERLLDALLETYVADRPQLIQPLYAALAEIAGNVVDHSGREHGYLALQRYSSRPRVEFAVGDSGMGLRARLSQTVPVPDDRAAIVQAAQTHVTTAGGPGRGRGISEVVAITGAHGGTVTLASGTARGVFARGDLHPRLQPQAPPQPGTLAHIRLSLEEARG